MSNRFFYKLSLVWPALSDIERQRHLERPAVLVDDPGGGKNKRSLIFHVVTFSSKTLGQFGAAEIQAPEGIVQEFK